jgi:hypothetical protein
MNKKDFVLVWLMYLIAFVILSLKFTWSGNLWIYHLWNILFDIFRVTIGMILTIFATLKAIK